MTMSYFPATPETMTMRRGGDVQIVKMMLRRIRADAGHADKLEAPLHSLLKHSRTAADFLRESKGTNSLVRAMKRHRNRPALLQPVMEILRHSIYGAKTRAGATEGAGQMCLEGLHDELLAILATEDYLRRDRGTIRDAVRLLVVVADYMVGYAHDSFWAEWSAKGAHLAAVRAMRLWTDDEEICRAGIYLLYILMAAGDEEVQRTLCGPALHVAIDASLPADAPLDRSSEEEMQKFLDLPVVLAAFRKDPILGVARKAWERHHGANQDIAKHGLHLQFGAIERQRRDRKFLTCTYCETPLPKRKERLICSACKSVIYCSRACQKQHWKKQHKRECQKIDDLAQDFANLDL